MLLKILFANLRTGDFIAPDRIRRVCVALIAFYAAAIAALFATSPDGMRDYLGRPIGSDFFAFWTAGVMAARGDALDAYDPGLNHLEQQRLLGDETPPFLPFLHPPPVLIAVTPLGAMPYFAALALFLMLGAGALGAVLTRLVPGRSALIAMAAAPAFFLNVTHGQAGLLVGALFGGALWLLDKRPIAAGILIGLIAVKPQYGLLIPIALVAAMRWRTIAAAAATVAAQVAAATLAFGAGVWPAFAEKLAYAQQTVLRDGGVDWAKYDTLYGALRAIGATAQTAFAAQGFLTAAIAASIYCLWRSGADLRLKGAGLIAGALLASPYSLDYDMALLLPAIALLVAHGLEKGFAPFEKSILALAWIAPLIAFQISSLTLIPVAFLAASLLLAAILRRSGPLHFGFPMARAAV